MTQAFKPREGLGSEDASRDLSVLLNQWLGAHGPSGIFQTCGNCKHMAQTGAPVCALYNMTPPVTVIIAGCPSHTDTHEIPF